jgi:hypothetical protein
MGCTRTRRHREIARKSTHSRVGGITPLLTKEQWSDMLNPSPDDARPARGRNGLKSGRPELAARHFDTSSRCDASQRDAPPQAGAGTDAGMPARKGRANPTPFRGGKLNSKPYLPYELMCSQRHGVCWVGSGRHPGLGARRCGVGRSPPPWRPRSRRSPRWSRGSVNCGRNPLAFRHREERPLALDKGLITGRSRPS